MCEKVTDCASVLQKKTNISLRHDSMQYPFLEAAGTPVVTCAISGMGFVLLGGIKYQLGNFYGAPASTKLSHRNIILGLHTMQLYRFVHREISSGNIVLVSGLGCFRSGKEPSDIVTDSQ
jgi:hypothetical protein